MSDEPRDPPTDQEWLLTERQAPRRGQPAPKDKSWVRTERSRRADLRPPAWFGSWFTLCALIGLIMLAGVGWLLLAAISWLNRH